MHATAVELPWEEGPILERGSRPPVPAATTATERPARTLTSVPDTTVVVLPDAPPLPPRSKPGPWHAAPLASLDLETTGRDPRGDRILAIALFRQEPDGDPVPIVDTLVDPGAEVVIPDGAAAVHGITRERLNTEAAPPLEHVLREVHAALVQLAAEGVGVVIYNAPFDWPFLASELARLDPALELPDCHLIDPLVLDRHVDKWRKGKRTLEAAAEVYGVTLDDAHEAAADALASLGVARAIGRTYLDVGGLSAKDLQSLQVEAHGVWRDDFNDYLRRISADRDPVVGSWPGLTDRSASPR